MREIDFEEIFQNIKQNVMYDEEITEDDMEDDSTENEVNEMAKVIFKRDFGFEYDEIEE